MDKLGEKLNSKLNQNINKYISEWYFNKGDKLFLCSDGIADNLSDPEIAYLMYSYRNAGDCLKNIVNSIYEIENQKIQKGTNNPPQYIQNNNNFKNTLKGSGDNISAIVVENESGER